MLMEKILSKVSAAWFAATVAAPSISGLCQFYVIKTFSTGQPVHDYKGGKSADDNLSFSRKERKYEQLD